MKSILSETRLKGKKVLVRADFNVPLVKGKVESDFRIRKTLGTLQYLQLHGARIIVISHLGRDPHQTLLPIADALKKYLPKVQFVSDVTGVAAHTAAQLLTDGEVLLLENLRSVPGEEEGSLEFAQELAGLADMYVNDAFSVAHRAHASVTGVPQFLPSYCGILFQDELAHLKEARAPKGKSLAILGGSKFETKEHLIELFLHTYTHVAVVGALANDFIKANGHEVGRSLVSNTLPPAHILAHHKLLVPSDVLIERIDGFVGARAVAAVGADERIVDIGPDTIRAIVAAARDAQFVVWNGPTGIYEKGFIDGTHGVADALAGCQTVSVVGGGDTVAALEELKITRHFTFISTAGGAMLEYLERGTLPGIEALEKSTI
jgi:3-phosphoglycerate kinase